MSLAREAPYASLRTYLLSLASREGVHVDEGLPGPRARHGDRVYGAVNGTDPRLVAFDLRGTEAER